MKTRYEKELNEAARRGLLLECQRLLAIPGDECPDVNTTIAIDAIDGNPDTENQFIDDGRTPLMWAITGQNNPELVRFLLKKGAKVNQQNPNGWAAMHMLYAKCWCFPKTALLTKDLLIAHGADMSLMTHFPGRWTPYQVGGYDANAMPLYEGSKGLIPYVHHEACFSPVPRFLSIHPVEEVGFGWWHRFAYVLVTESSARVDKRTPEDLSKLICGALLHKGMPTSETTDFEAGLHYFIDESARAVVCLKIDRTYEVIIPPERFDAFTARLDELYRDRTTLPKLRGDALMLTALAVAELGLHPSSPTLLMDRNRALFLEKEGSAEVMLKIAKVYQFITQNFSEITEVARTSCLNSVIDAFSVCIDGFEGRLSHLCNTTLLPKAYDLKELLYVYRINILENFPTKVDFEFSEVHLANVVSNLAAVAFGIKPRQTRESLSRKEELRLYKILLEQFQQHFRYYALKAGLMDELKHQFASLEKRVPLDRDLLVFDALSEEKRNNFAIEMASDEKKSQDVFFYGKYVYLDSAIVYVNQAGKVSPVRRGVTIEEVSACCIRIDEHTYQLPVAKRSDLLKQVYFLRNPDEYYLEENFSVIDGFFSDIPDYKLSDFLLVEDETMEEDEASFIIGLNWAHVERALMALIDANRLFGCEFEELASHHGIVLRLPKSHDNYDVFDFFRHQTLTHVEFMVFLSAYLKKYPLENKTLINGLLQISTEKQALEASQYLLNRGGDLHQVVSLIKPAPDADVERLMVFKENLRARTFEYPEDPGLRERKPAGFNGYVPPAMKQKLRQEKTHLMNAISSGDLQHVMLFLKHGSPVNIANSEGWTALHELCYASLLYATKDAELIFTRLIARGANLFAKTKDNHLPSDVAQNAAFRQRVLQEECDLAIQRGNQLDFYNSVHRGLQLNRGAQRLDMVDVQASHEKSLKQHQAKEMKLKENLERLQAKKNKFAQMLDEQFEINHWIENRALSAYPMPSDAPPTLRVMAALFQVIFKKYQAFGKSAPLPGGWSARITYLLEKADLSSLTPLDEGSLSRMLGVIHQEFGIPLAINLHLKDREIRAVMPTDDVQQLTLTQCQQEICLIVPTSLCYGHQEHASLLQRALLFQGGLLETLCIERLIYEGHPDWKSAPIQALETFLNEEVLRVKKCKTYQDFQVLAPSSAIIARLAQFESDSTWAKQEAQEYFQAFVQSYVEAMKDLFKTEWANQDENNELQLMDGPLEQLELQIRTQQEEIQRTEDALDDRLQEIAQKEEVLSDLSLKASQNALQYQEALQDVMNQLAVLEALVEEKKGALATDNAALRARREEVAGQEQRAADLEALRRQLDAEKERLRAEHRASIQQIQTLTEGLSALNESRAHLMAQIHEAESMKAKALESDNTLMVIKKFIMALQSLVLSNEAIFLEARLSLRNLLASVQRGEVTFLSYYQALVANPLCHSLESSALLDEIESRRADRYFEACILGLHEMIKKPEIQTQQGVYVISGTNLSFKECYQAVSDQVDEALAHLGLTWDASGHLMVVAESIDLARLPQSLKQLLAERVRASKTPILGAMPDSEPLWEELKARDETARMFISDLKLRRQEVLPCWIKRIEVKAGHHVFVEDDITLPGIDLTLCANGNIFLKEGCKVDTSGLDGLPIQQVKARHGKHWRIGDVPQGSDGEPGLCGLAGKSAGHIYIRANGEITHSATLTCIANGGRGGDGQQGGDGDQGREGKMGIAAKLYLIEDEFWIFGNDKMIVSEGLDPGVDEYGRRIPGSPDVSGDGGNGGQAGLGGEGGKKGHVIVEDKHQSLAVSQITANDGLEGADGERTAKGGAAGIAGFRGLPAITIHSYTGGWFGGFKSKYYRGNYNVPLLGSWMSHEREYYEQLSIGYYEAACAFKHLPTVNLETRRSTHEYSVGLDKSGPYDFGKRKESERQKTNIRENSTMLSEHRRALQKDIQTLAKLKTIEQLEAQMADEKLQWQACIGIQVERLARVGGEVIQKDQAIAQGNAELIIKEQAKDRLVSEISNVERQIAEGVAQHAILAEVHMEALENLRLASDGVTKAQLALSHAEIDLAAERRVRERLGQNHARVDALLQAQQELAQGQLDVHLLAKQELLHLIHSQQARLNELQSELAGLEDTKTRLKAQKEAHELALKKMKEHVEEEIQRREEKKFVHEVAPSSRTEKSKNLGSRHLEQVASSLSPEAFKALKEEPLSDSFDVSFEDKIRFRSRFSESIQRDPRALAYFTAHFPVVYQCPKEDKAACLKLLHELAHAFGIPASDDIDTCYFNLCQQLIERRAAWAVLVGEKQPLPHEVEMHFGLLIKMVQQFGDVLMSYPTEHMLEGLGRMMYRQVWERIEHDLEQNKGVELLARIEGTLVQVTSADVPATQPVMTGDYWKDFLCRGLFSDVLTGFPEEDVATLIDSDSWSIIEESYQKLTQSMGEKKEFQEILHCKRHLLTMHSIAKIEEKEAAFVQCMEVAIKLRKDGLPIKDLNRMLAFMSYFEDFEMLAKHMTNHKDKVVHRVLYHALELVVSKSVLGTCRNMVLLKGNLCSKEGGLRLLEILIRALSTQAEAYGRIGSASKFEALLERLIALKAVDDTSLLEDLAERPLLYWDAALKRRELSLQLGLEHQNKMHQKLLDKMIYLQKRSSSSNFQAWMACIQAQVPIHHEALSGVIAKFYTLEWDFDDKALKVIQDQPMELWQAMLDAHFLSEKASHRNIRDAAKISELMCQESSDFNQGLKPLLDSEGGLVALVDRVKCQYESIKHQDKAFIQAYAKGCGADFLQKGGIENGSLVQFLAVMMLAYRLENPDKNIHDTQLLAMICFAAGFDREPNQGRLANISTGEGKTLIIQMMVIARVLRGERVDAVTSSEVLAQTNAAEARKLFEYFNIKVSNNCDDKAKSSMNVRKERYANHQVIFGDIGSFQRDMLLTDYMDEKIRPNKAHSLVIDEVDSLLIDNAEKVLYLSHKIGDLKHLRPLIEQIWLWVHSKDTPFYSEKNCEFIASMIQKQIDDKSLQIPANLMDFAERHLHSWIQNAYMAKAMDIDGQYSVMDKGDGMTGVVINDLPTGVEQPHSQWSQGLHAFVQMKNLEPLTEESLRAIYISNYTYIKRYADRGALFGMSGTLGGEAERALLEKSYGVDFFKLPRFKKEQYRQEEAIVVGTEGECFEKAILEQVRAKVRAGSPVLLICQDKKTANALHKLISDELKEPTANLYPAYTSASQKFTVREGGLVGGDIVIATNLAGRGTDLAVSDECAHGMHVILTYMPSNIRIEEQAFGRSARQGKPGSGQFIVADARANDRTVWIEELRDERDELECLRLNDLRYVKMQAVALEDELFCKAMVFEAKMKEKLKERGIHGELLEIQLQSLRNSWSFWLDEHSEVMKNPSPASKEKIASLFSEWKNSMLKRLTLNETLFVATPSELFLLGRYHMKHERNLEAIQCFDQVIQIDPEFAKFAYYYRAQARIGKGCGRAGKVLARADLKEAIRLFEKSIDNLSLSNQIIKLISEQYRHEGRGSRVDAFTKHNLDDMCSLNAHLQAAKAAAGSSLTAKHFESIGYTEKEAVILFEQLRRDLPDELKDHRVSKKVSVVDDCLYYKGKKVEIPAQFLPFKADLLAMLREMQGLKRHQDRKLNLQALASCVLTKDKWLTLLKDHLLSVTVVKPHAEINEHCMGESYWQHPRFKGYGAAIKASVLRFKGEKLKSECLDELKSSAPLAEVDWSLVYDALIHDEIFQEEPGFVFKPETMRLIQEAGTNPILPLLGSGFEPSSLVESTIVALSKEPHFTTSSLIQLPDTGSQMIHALWDFLQHEHVVREPAVYFPEISDEENVIQNRIKEIDSAIYRSVRSLDLTQKILKVLTSSTGTLRTISEVMLKNESLEHLFEEKKVPPIVIEYLQEACSDVLSLVKYEDHDTWAAFWCAMLGVAQIMIGILLCAAAIGCPALVYFGEVLISEGVGDISFAAQSALNGNFTWEAYGKHKAMSLAISLITVGVATGLGGEVNKIYELSEFGANVSKEILKASVGVAFDVGVSMAMRGIAESLIKKLFEIFKSNLSKNVRESAGVAFQNMSAHLTSLYEKLSDVELKHVMDSAILELNLSKVIGEDIATKARSIMQAVSSKLSGLKSFSDKGQQALAKSLALALELEGYTSGLASITMTSGGLINELSLILERAAARVEARDEHAVDSRALEAWVDKAKEEMTGVILGQVEEQVKQIFTKGGVRLVNLALEPVIKASNAWVDESMNKLFGIKEPEAHLLAKSPEPSKPNPKTPVKNWIDLEDLIEKGVKTIKTSSGEKSVKAIQETQKASPKPIQVTLRKGEYYQVDDVFCKKDDALYEPFIREELPAAPEKGKPQYEYLCSPEDYEEFKKLYKPEPFPEVEAMPSPTLGERLQDELPGAVARGVAKGVINRAFPKLPKGMDALCSPGDALIDGNCEVPEMHEVVLDESLKILDPIRIRMAAALGVRGAMVAGPVGAAVGGVLGYAVGSIPGQSIKGALKVMIKHQSEKNDEARRVYNARFFAGCVHKNLMHCIAPPPARHEPKKRG